MQIARKLAVGCAAVVCLSTIPTVLAAGQSPSAAHPAAPAPAAANQAASPTLPAAPTAAPVAAAAPQIGPDGMPVGPGHETLVRVCSGCHAPQVVLDKRLSYPDWDALVQSMVARGAQATEEDVTQITDYLATNYPVAS